MHHKIHSSFIFRSISDLESGDKTFVVELVQLMDEYLPIKDYPFGDDQTKEYDAWVRSQL